MKAGFVLLLVALGNSPLLLGDSCPASVAAKLSQVSRYLDHGDFDPAEAALKQGPASSSDCPELVLLRARIAAGKDDSSGAADLFARYLQAAPEDPKGYAYFARMLIDSGDYARADEMSAIAIEMSSSDSAALAVRGQILAMRGDKQRGVELLSQACRLDPEDAEAAFQLGSIYDRAKLPEDAIKYFKQAAELDPEDARAWDYLALNLEPLGRIKEADDAYTKALKVNREGPHYDAFADYNYGRFLMKAGNLSASKAHLDRAVQLVPDMRATWYERAKLDLLMKDFQAGRRDAEKAASLADAEGIIIDLQVYTILERIYRRLGETDLANKYAELERTTPPPVRGERH